MMSKYEMTLDEKLDEVLDVIKEDRWIDYEQVKLNIKQLIEEVQTESYKKGYINKGIEELNK